MRRKVSRDRTMPGLLHTTLPRSPAARVIAYRSGVLREQALRSVAIPEAMTEERGEIARCILRHPTRHRFQSPMRLRTKPNCIAPPPEITAFGAICRTKTQFMKFLKKSSCSAVVPPINLRPTRKGR